MYRRSTPIEWRRYGVPHRIVGSPWYRSSNTACVYPLIQPAPDWRQAARHAKDAPLEDILVAEGLAQSRYVLEINGHLQVPVDENFGDPWNLPSRLMQFPLEARFDKTGQMRVGLMHPALAEHPFVKRVAKVIRPHKIGLSGAPNAAGYSQAPATWWHACDLIRSHSDDLLRTRQFTSEGDIVRAVSHALDHRGGGDFGPPEARKVLTAVPAPPPANIVDTVLMLSPPSVVQPEKGPPYWPINSTRRDWSGLSWLRVWGIEAGWFNYSRTQYLGWAPHGRSMYHSVEAMAATPEQRARYFGITDAGSEVPL
jgi:hypothetical protein